MHFTEYDTRLAAYGLIVRDEQILLAWYNGKGQGRAGWTLPGGGVEFDESMESAVAREVFEETGYRVSVGGPIATDHFAVTMDEVRGRPFKSQRVLFDATITGGDLGTTEVDGTTDFARWIPLDETGAMGYRSRIVDIALGIVAGR
ncbi:NUDIX hydrolase [Flexivirga caeni]|uniref:NUDIX domain-containing protein n=1 Tax=Flexivirga caeni TaxID=2294115 RepID=A0A3M9M837_9MICO|nr:NUDIX hydrolase [Flexivirga caeni]RNI21729.1 NUDIX domain-containing protein [Flexivirga caeni]